MSLPRVSPLSNLEIFKFYENYAIYEAVLHEGTIMKLARVFTHEQREEALRFAQQLSKEYATLISPSPTDYRVWVDIRCQLSFGLAYPISP